MAYVISHNVVSPLGLSTKENLDATINNRTAIKNWNGRWGIAEDFAASLFTDSQADNLKLDGLTLFEAIAVRSAREAIKAAGIDTGSSHTLFILSTTKGNVQLLECEKVCAERALPVQNAVKIAQALGVTTMPMVVDNACISGLSAIILADRLLHLGLYDNAIVCGTETQCKFIVSGFMSLKAMSAKHCRPFDMGRNGLNLGEAAATVILGNSRKADDEWQICRGAVCNDAYHISAPSKTAEGAYKALLSAVGCVPADELAFICAHGTATLFNDQMESVAIQRAGLGSVPVNALKGIFGHTMGACGVLETCLSLAAANEGIVLPTNGFCELGVTGKINIARKWQRTDKKSFIKMLSGFGGCNAALLVSKDIEFNGCTKHSCNYFASHNVKITPTAVSVDGCDIDVPAEGKALLTALYKEQIDGYAKFYKMDILSRLGFVATELLLQAEGQERFAERDDRAVVFVGRSGSVCADIKYLDTIANADDFYPSPERVVYTLPNIVTGEVAIRNKYHGETAFYLIPQRDPAIEKQLLAATLADGTTKSAVFGWIDCENEDSFEADISIITKQQ